VSFRQRSLALEGALSKSRRYGWLALRSYLLTYSGRCVVRVLSAALVGLEGGDGEHVLSSHAQRHDAAQDNWAVHLRRSVRRGG